MAYLIDSNVLSEPTHKTPNEGCIQWLAEHSDLFISALTIGEVWKGIVLVEKRHEVAALRLRRWIESVETAEPEKILPVTAEISRQWGMLQTGRTLPVIDAYIAATALVHQLTVVTRNTKDFADIPGLDVVNPFSPNVQ